MPLLFSQHNGGVPACHEIARDFFLGCSENFFLDRLSLTVLRVEDFRQRSGFSFAVRPQKLQRFFCRAQSASRVQAHLLVCFLAYVLRKTLEGWMARAGLGNSPTTVLEELARIQSTDVVAPTTDGRTMRLRCVVRPDKAQSLLLDHLGLKLPQRLRLPAGMGQM